MAGPENQGPQVSPSNPFPRTSGQVMGVIGPASLKGIFQCLLLSCFQEREGERCGAAAGSGLAPSQSTEVLEWWWWWWGAVVSE